jgi:urea transport system permease protein
MTSVAELPLPLRERKGPIAKRWEGEGDLTASRRSIYRRQPPHPPHAAHGSPPSPAGGEGLRWWFAAIFLCLAVFLLGTARPSHAEDLPSLITALGAEDFDGRIRAVDALGAFGDGHAIPALQALNDGNLYTTGDKRVVIAESQGAGYKLTDAVTLAPLGEASSDAVDKVRVNNRLRGAIAGALSQLMLFSPNRDDRLSAARDALKHGSAESAATLEKALAAETDPELRAVMQSSLFGIRLNAGTEAQRIAAIAGLAGSNDPEVGSLLAQLAAAPDTDAKVRDAAKSALASLERRQFYIGLGLNLFQGISLGSVLLLAAIGLAITFGVMGVINMAHGEMIMLGAYSAYVVQEIFRATLPASLFGWYLIVAVPVAFVVAGAVGILLERCIIRFLYGRPLETLLATWGISLMLQQAVRMVFGAPNKEVSNPSWMTGGFEAIGGFFVTWNRLYIILFCFVVLGILVLIVQRTHFGLQMRAVTQNRDMARAMGIPSARVDALTFGLGSGIAGMAGVALSQIGNVSPNLGTIYIVDSFLVVVFGGVGNLTGTLVGAMSLGIVNKFLEPVAGAVLGKVVILVAIILFIQRRPRGLFALKGRTVEA